MAEKVPTSEREQTDESLRVERENADRTLEEDGAAVDDTADAVIARARARADRVLAEGRARTDRQAGTGAAPARIVQRERLVEDLLLRDERANADEALREERAEHVALLSHEREETDKDLSNERARSDAAVTTRDEFLGIVSHDLRNMLTAMVGFASLIVNAPPAQEDGAPARLYETGRSLTNGRVRFSTPSRVARSRSRRVRPQPPDRRAPPAPRVATAPTIRDSAARVLMPCRRRMPTSLAIAVARRRSSAASFGVSASTAPMVPPATPRKQPWNRPQRGDCVLNGTSRGPNRGVLNGTAESANSALCSRHDDLFLLRSACDDDHHREPVSCLRGARARILDRATDLYPQPFRSLCEG